VGDTWEKRATEPKLRLEAGKEKAGYKIPLL